LAETAPDFYLLAHSHGVSLLDGMTDWREAHGRGATHDPRYGDAFQGWFEGAVPRYPFDAAVVKGAPSLKKLVALVISAGTGIGPLVQPVTRPPAASLEVRVNPELANVLQAWRGHVPIVSMINGNEHALTMLNRWPPYDFIDEDVAGIDRDAPIIDEVFVNEHIEPWIASVFVPLAVLRQIAGNPLLHVLPPPPRENPQNSRHLEVLQDAVAQFGFAPDRLRLKWYRRYCRRLSERLATVGCKVLVPPPEACSPQGMLKDEYAEGLTHGNDRYGTLTATRIESWLNEFRP
jgi:hypothetical protein